jgi:MoxR-like ATPase
MLDRHDYVADRRLATSVFLALKMRRPLFLEGEAGVGKTEIAKVLAAALGEARPAPVLRRASTSRRRSTNGTTRGR